MIATALLLAAVIVAGLRLAYQAGKAEGFIEGLQVMEEVECVRPSEEGDMAICDWPLRWRCKRWCAPTNRHTTPEASLTAHQRSPTSY